jgi:hypothetical protein
MTWRGAVVAVLVGFGALIPGVAAAQPATSTIISTLDDDEPGLPAPVVLHVEPLGTGIAAANPTPVPLVVLGPDGRAFLRIAASGVDVDAAAPFTYVSRHATTAATDYPPGVSADAPPRWSHVSDDVSWRWYDARVRPVVPAAPVGGRSDVATVLGRWTIPLRYGDASAVIGGTLESRPVLGRFVPAVDAGPGGVSAVAVDGDPPRMVLQAPVGATVLGVDGEEFLRRTAAGWEVSTSSRTYRLDALSGGRSVGPDTGWQPFGSGASVSWSDDRLRAPGGPPTASMRWSIPVRLDGATTAVTGSIRFVARPGLPDVAVTQPTRGVLIPIGAAATAAVALAGLLLLDRRRMARLAS